MPSTAVEITPVAVGILEDAEGRILVAQRPEHKHQGGKWEFPGGKIAPTESMPAALARELHEELGISLRAASPMLRTRHAYPDKKVLLDVWRVLDFSGTPHGREGQPIRWVRPHEFEQLNLPAADVPIVQALNLPAFYLITDSHRYGKLKMLGLIERALQAGARMLQVREPHMTQEEYVEFARQIIALAHAHGARVLLNADPDIVPVCDADGVHLNSRRLLAASTRPLPLPYLIAASCHDPTELARAAALGADFSLLSPVLPTTSHPDRPALGWQEFARLRLQSDIPVYALGGMQTQHLHEARLHGAHGVAMIGGAWDVASIETTLAVRG